MTEAVKIGVIGGSGLYQMPELTDVVTQPVDTPFGKPSADVVIGTLRGKRVAFLPRHGIGHVYTPTAVPYRANIYALKMLDVRYIIAVNACGSLRDDYAPGHIVIPDQLFDYTKERKHKSFFEEGVVAHVSVAEPFSQSLSDLAAESVRRIGGVAHQGGTYITVEGPRFSTRGESHIFRQWGCSIIGMTTCPEAFLAREAEIAYTTMSHVTDYDVWHVSEAPVTVEMVVQTMYSNLRIAQNALADAIDQLDENADDPAHHALDFAVMTDRRAMPPDVLARLKPIIGRLYQEA
jgi:5'-methylthioadenosine phosphorylase